MLQQSLPFTVLKPLITSPLALNTTVATVLTVYGIETLNIKIVFVNDSSCNSPYRLRY